MKQITLIVLAICCIIPLFHSAVSAQPLCDKLELGVTYHGTAKSSETGKIWPFEISLDRLSDNPANKLDGMIYWPSLDSAHAVKATLQGDTIQFTETEIIVKGKAHLNVSYTGTFHQLGQMVNIAGDFKDPAGDKGSFTLQLADKEGRRFNMREDMFNKKGRRGTAKSARSGKSWPFVIEMDGSMATELQDFEGVIEWPTLNSLHSIRGLYMYGKLTFKEESALKKGKAHTGVSYTLWLENGALVGEYKDPKGDYGTVYLPIK